MEQFNSYYFLLLYHLPIQNFKTLTSKGFQGRGTNGVQELKVSTLYL
jgi:hypothetical protein